MTEGPAGLNRLNALARRLARRRGGSVAPIPREVHDDTLRDLDLTDGEATGVKGGATSYGVQCGYPGYYCPPGYRTCRYGVCYP